MISRRAFLASSAAAAAWVVLPVVANPAVAYYRAPLFFMGPPLPAQPLLGDLYLDTFKHRFFAFDGERWVNSA